MRVGDSFIADVNRFAQAVALRDRQRRRRRPGGARHAQQLEPRPRGGRLRLPPRRHRDRLRRRRGRPAQQLALEPAARDPRQLGDDPRSPCRRRRDQSYLAVQRLHELQRQDHPRDPLDELLLGRGRARLPGWPGSIYSAPRSNAHDEGRAASRIPTPPHCRRVNGDPCVITPNEVRQLMASGDGRRRRRWPTTSTSRLAARPDRALLLSRPRRPAARTRTARERLQAQVDANRPVADRAAAAVRELPRPRGPRPVLRLRPGEHATARQGDARRPRATRRPVMIPPEAEITSPSGTSRSTRPRRRSTSRARSSRAAPPTPARSSSRPASTRTTPHRPTRRPATSRRLRDRLAATARRAPSASDGGSLGSIVDRPLKARFPRGRPTSPAPSRSREPGQRQRPPEHRPARRSSSRSSSTRPRRRAAS